MDETAPSQPAAQRPGWRWGWRKALLAAVLGLVGLIALVTVVINSPIGHRLIANRIASYAPASAYEYP